MIKTVKNFIVENNLQGKTILAGLSGGVDSSVLCDILSALVDELKLNLIAVHLNHNWRGDASCMDEKFAREFAKARKIAFYSQMLSNSVKKTETAAREARYKFFEKCKNKFNADAVFLAHNKNDNVETLIYRLAKGTGPRGLISIPKERDFYFRPLLDFTREQIEEYISKNRISFIVDKSNFNTKYKRSLIRQKILPAFGEINKNVINSISTFIELNKMNQTIVDRVILQALDEIAPSNGDFWAFRDKFLALPVEIRFELISRNFQGILKNRDYKTIKKLHDFILNQTSKKISINAEYFLKVYDNKIYIPAKNNTKMPDETLLQTGENCFGQYILTVEKCCMPDIFPKNNTAVQYLELDFKNLYTIRTRKEGDIIQPFGSKNPQKLKTLFIKKKIASETRGQIPLIALENEILLVLGVVQSEKSRVVKNENCYKITVKRDK